jgi:hypothetical protein
MKQVYLYDAERNITKIKDRYSDELIGLPLDVVLLALQHDADLTNPRYRRYEVALASLRVFANKEYWGSKEPIYCVFAGY